MKIIRRENYSVFISLLWNKEEKKRQRSIMPRCVASCAWETAAARCLSLTGEYVVYGELRRDVGKKNVNVRCVSVGSSSTSGLCNDGGEIGATAPLCVLWWGGEGVRDGVTWPGIRATTSFTVMMEGIANELLWTKGRNAQGRERTTYSVSGYAGRGGGKEVSK